MEDRAYQDEAVEKVKQSIRAGNRRILLSGPTGCGKTIVSIKIVRGSVRKGKWCEFICDRQNLVNQTSERFSAAGIEHGMLMSDSSHSTYMATRVSSAQTIESRGLWRREVVNGLFTANRIAPHLAIVDEAHEMRRKLLAMLKEAGCITIGLTATPFKPELAEFYEDMVVITPTKPLIAQGFLAPLQVVYPEAVIDVKGVKVSAGEFQKKELTKRVLRIVGEIVPTWQKQVDERFDGVPQQTIVFCASIAESEKICDLFRAAGHDFRVIHSKMDENDVKNTIDGFKRNEFIGIVNVMILTRGSDFPNAVILSNCYPTRSFTNVVQKFGRVMRTHPGKECGVLIDHGEDWMAFYDELQRFYSFGPSPLGDDKEHKAKRKERPKNPKTVCKSCGTVFQPGQFNCSNCGAARPRMQEPGVGKYKYVEGILQARDELTGETFERDIDIWEECCAAALQATHGDEARAKKRAFAGYVSITGDEDPKRRFVVRDREPDPVVKDMMRKSFQAWIIKQRYREKKMAAG